MKRLFSFIVVIVIGFCSVNAQNTTVTGPKKQQPREVKKKTNGTNKKKKKETISSPTGYINGHGYVDLGLSVKWGTCNVGAATPSEYGDKFAWGETTTKSSFTGQNYTFYKNGKAEDFIYIGDDITGTKYDAARANWGQPWRMPTKEEIQELIDKCVLKWIKYRDHYGYKVQRDGKSIFLPAVEVNKNSDYVSFYGRYWSSSIWENSNGIFASNFYIGGWYGSHYITSEHSCFGLVIRPVIGY